MSPALLLLTILLSPAARAQEASPWVTEWSNPGQWPEWRTVSVPGDPPWQAWPSLVDTPRLVVACDDARLQLYVKTSVQPEVYGTAYDRFLTMVLYRFDDEDRGTELGLRKDVAPGQLHFRNPKKWLKTLRAHALFHVQIVPFGSNPTATTFALDGLDDALGVIGERCRL